MSIEDFTRGKQIELKTEGGGDGGGGGDSKRHKETKRSKERQRQTEKQRDREKMNVVVSALEMEDGV